jgi:enoyl-CoA hydratase
MTSFEHITVERDGEPGLALITIRREKALNALSSAVVAELSDAVAALEGDDDVRVVALTGAGDKAFVAGADIGEMTSLGPREAQALAARGGALAAAIEGSAKVYIAAINGFALGGGCEIALACDFIYASERAKLGQPEVKLGVIPGFGGTQRLLRRVGVAKAKELIFSGDMISAEEAHRIGLVDALTAPEQLFERVRACARAIAKNGPLAVAEAKRVMHAGQSMTLEHAVDLEQRAFAGLFATADQKEGMDAFLSKRAAAFSGR